MLDKLVISDIIFSVFQPAVFLLILVLSLLGVVVRPQLILLGKVASRADVAR